MIEPAQNPRVRQVVIALDNAGSTVTACEAALELAVELRAELHGLFIEDVDLLRASALPFVQEIGVPSARLQPFTVESVERELQSIGARARALLAELAGEAKIEWQFHVRRDSFPRALHNAVENADLVVVGPRLSPLRTDRPAAAKDRARLAGPLVVLFDCRAAAKRALEAAMDVRRVGGSNVVVWIIGDRQSSNERRDEVAALMKAAKLPGTIEPAVARTISDVVDLARRHSPRLILIGADNPLLNEPGLRMLIDRLECSVGVVR